MEGEVTMICVDTSMTDINWFHDQIQAVKIYCQRKLKAHPDNLVGIATSRQLDTGSFLAPTNSPEKVTFSLNALKGCEQDYTNLLQRFEHWFGCVWAEHSDMKKRIVVFTGGPLHFIAGAVLEPIPPSLKQGRVVLDVIDFGHLVKGTEDFEAKSDFGHLVNCIEYFKTRDLMELVVAMNENNGNEDGHYYFIQNDGFTLSHHMFSSSILPPLVAKDEAPVSRTSMLSMKGEVTMICVDTSITNLCWFYDQMSAVEIYCRHKLKADPNNLVSIARFGQQDFGICHYPTNCLDEVTYILCTLRPLEQEYTDLLEAFELFGPCWFGQADMNKRIVLFSGRPLLSTTGELPESIPPFSKMGRVALDVIDFGPRVEGKDDSKANYLRALVDAMNDNENEDSHYFLFEGNGISVSHHISRSIIPKIAPIIHIPDIPDDHIPDIPDDHIPDIPDDIAQVVDSGRFNDVEVVDSGWITDVEEEVVEE